MAHQVVKQPNGNLALWSTIIDKFLVYNLSEAQMVEYLQEDRYFRMDWEIELMMEKGLADAERWIQKAWHMLIVHGPENGCTDVLAAAGMPQAEIDLWLFELDWARSQLDTNGGTDIAPPFD